MNIEHAKREYLDNLYKDNSTFSMNMNIYNVVDYFYPIEPEEGYWILHNNSINAIEIKTGLSLFLKRVVCEYCLEEHDMSFTDKYQMDLNLLPVIIDPEEWNSRICDYNRSYSDNDDKSMELNIVEQMITNTIVQKVSDYNSALELQYDEKLLLIVNYEKIDYKAKELFNNLLIEYQIIHNDTVLLLSHDNAYFQYHAGRKKYKYPGGDENPFSEYIELIKYYETEFDNKLDENGIRKWCNKIAHNDYGDKIYEIYKDPLINPLIETAYDLMTVVSMTDKNAVSRFLGCNPVSMIHMLLINRYRTETYFYEYAELQCNDCITFMSYCLLKLLLNGKKRLILPDGLRDISSPDFDELVLFLDYPIEIVSKKDSKSFRYKLAYAKHYKNGKRYKKYIDDQYFQLLTEYDEEGMERMMKIGRVFQKWYEEAGLERENISNRLLSNPREISLSNIDEQIEFKTNCYDFLVAYGVANLELISVPIFIYKYYISDKVISCDCLLLLLSMIPDHMYKRPKLKIVLSLLGTDIAFWQKYIEWPFISNKMHLTLTRIMVRTLLKERYLTENPDNRKAVFDLFTKALNMCREQSNNVYIRALRNLYDSFPDDYKSAYQFYSSVLEKDIMLSSDK